MVPIAVHLCYTGYETSYRNFDEDDLNVSYFRHFKKLRAEISTTLVKDEMKRNKDYVMRRSNCSSPIPLWRLDSDIWLECDMESHMPDMTRSSVIIGNAALISLEYYP